MAVTPSTEKKDCFRQALALAWERLRLAQGALYQAREMANGRRKWRRERGFPDTMIGP
jgi:hypothetical protein